ncbi:MAG: prepilin peptidase, partial [Planctomycetes bacterium]|nr:prepilin peptidase [Planctomycetota bacterium]
MLTVLLLSQIIHFRREQISQLNRYEKRIWDAGFCLKCVLGIVFTWGIIFPLTTSFWNSFSNERLAKLERLPLISDIGFRLSESFVTLCFALFGANVGSFLNVVVWRVPRGESVIWGESHCPKCASKIRTTDNLPILGWLRLGGRCRDCQTDISTRYPIVESITMFAFLLYYFVQLISGGANIPFRSINSYRGVLWIIMYPKWDLIGLYLYHIGLFSLLLVWALILRDGGRIPRRSMIYSLLITALVQVAAPALFVVSPFAPLKSLSVIPTQHLLHVGISLTFAILVGSTFAVLLKSLFLQNDVSGWENIAFPLCLTGIAQGWQSIFFISLFLVAIRCCFPKGQLRASSFAMTVLVLHILSFVFWRLEWQAILHSLSITT